MAVRRHPHLTPTLSHHQRDGYASVFALDLPTLDCRTSLLSHRSASRTALMSMQLDQVVPFGRSLDEYRLMFSFRGGLGEAIIGIADGPASFNAEMHALGKRVVSVDPLYAFSGADIEQRFYAVVDDTIRQGTSTPDDWVWSYHHSADHLRDNRVQALRQFVTDFETGRAEGRYATGALPQLDFTRDQFDLALCSHFLFLYSDHFPYAFHRAAIAEMLRVAAEVRIFP